MPRKRGVFALFFIKRFTFAIYFLEIEINLCYNKIRKIRKELFYKKLLLNYYRFF